MEFSGVKEYYRRSRPLFDDTIKEVCEQGSFINGPQVRELEEQLISRTGAKHAIGVSSGTDALVIALEACLEEPTTVVTTPFTFIATAEAIVRAGHDVAFVDIDPDTFLIDMDAAKKEGNVILGVDLFGQFADYRGLPEGYTFIQDAAQSFGARQVVIDGQCMYKYGVGASVTVKAACTSFFPAKPFGCFGDGGMIFTNDGYVAAKAESLREHGKSRQHKYDNKYIGHNARLDTLQAAVLLAKLPSLGDDIKSRQAVAWQYTQALDDVVKTPDIAKDNIPVWAQYCVLLPEGSDRDEIQRRLEMEFDVPTAVYYPKPLHQQTAFAEQAADEEWVFPVAEAVSKRILALPIHPFLMPRDVEQVIRGVTEVCS